MASPVGTLAVAITARTSQLTAGLRGAGQEVGGFASRIGGLAKRIVPVGAAIAGIAGSLRGMLEVSRQFGQIDEIAKWADTMGMATEEAVGLRHAADLAGIGITSLERGMRTVASTGETGLAAVLTAAEEMEGMEDPAERLNFAMERFGQRAGADLIPLLNEGRDAIAEMAREGDDLAGFSREDAAQVEAANDALARMKLSFSGVARDIAILVAPAVEKVGDLFTWIGRKAREFFEFVRPVAVQMGAVFMSAVGTIGEMFSSVFGGMGGTAAGFFTTIKDFILDWLIISQFVWENAGDIARLAWERTKLGAVSFFEDIKFFFTGTLPALFEWFSREWRNIFFTAFDLATTVMINIGQNIRNLFQSIWDFIAGRGWDFAFTPITEGFVNTIGSLELPERPMSDLERELKGRVDGMTEDLGTRLGDFMVQRRAELEMDLSTDTKFEIEPGPELDELPGRIGEAMEGGIEALERDSVQAFSAILGAMRGQDTDREQLQVAKRQLTEQELTRRAVEGLADREGLDLVAGEI